MQATPIQDDDLFQALRVRDASGDLLTDAEQAWFDAFARRAPMPAATCPDCGETFATCAAFGAHRREAHLRATGGRSVVWNKDSMSRGDGFTEAEARAFIRGPASSFNDPKTRRVARKAVRRLARHWPAAPALRTRQGQGRHPRRRRSTSRARARAPGRESDGDEPPPLKPCERCGEPFEPKYRVSVYCPACRNAAKCARHREKVAVATGADAVLDRYRDEIAKARWRNLLDADEALDLLCSDADEARDRLLRAAPEHLRPDVLRLFAGVAA